MDARLVNLTVSGPEEHGKAFLGVWGRWIRFDETLDGLEGRWSVGYARSRGIVFLCLLDDRMRLDVVTCSEEAIARGWPASLWPDEIASPIVSVAKKHQPDQPISPSPLRSDPLPALRQIDDDRGAEAVEVVRRAGHASVSMLQRELGIGHARAARIIGLMERAGVIGSAGPRKLRALR